MDSHARKEEPPKGQPKAVSVRYKEGNFGVPEYLQGDMGASLSAEERAGKERSAQIDRQIKEDSQRLRSECKVLLIGSEESGKSTLVKQLKILYGDGFTEDELLRYRPVVNKNIVELAQNVTNAMIKFSLQPVNNVNQDYMMRIKDFQYDPDPSLTLPYSLGEAIESLWKDQVIEKLTEHSNEFSLMDSAADYFLSHARRICSRNYVPSEIDVLHAQAKTTGISEAHVKKDALCLHLFDVGFQKSERRKWVNCFESVTSVIFVVSLSEYDQVVPENQSLNRLQESLLLFESIINSRWLAKASIILFLNKIDVFRAKLPHSPLAKYFPDYEGGDDVQEATNFIRSKFRQLNRGDLLMFSHITQATDTDHTRFLFAAVIDTLIRDALDRIGRI